MVNVMIHLSVSYLPDSQILEEVISSNMVLNHGWLLLSFGYCDQIWHNPEFLM